MLNSEGLKFIFYNFDKTDQSLCGSSTLVSNLRKHNYFFDFQFVETFASINDAYQAISSFKPDVVGFTATNTTFCQVEALAKLVKENTQALVLLGGSNLSAPPTSMPKYVDIWFLGKPENTIIELFNSCDNYSININEIKKINDIAFFDENGHLQINSQNIVATPKPECQCKQQAPIVNDNMDLASVKTLINKYWHPVGHLNEDQKNFLINFLMEKKPRYCIETGFASGRSAVTTLVSANPIKLVSIDLSLDYCGARKHAESLLEVFKNLTIREGNSGEILTEEFFQKEFPGGIDYAFVDGDHSYEGALTDVSHIYAKLNPNGYMIIDDFESGPPNGAVLEGVNIAVHHFCKTNNIYIQKWYDKGKGFAILRKS